MRILFSLMPAGALVFGLFWLLQGMITVGAKPFATDEKLHMVEFVRLKKKQPLVKKKRFTPKKPKPEKPPEKPRIAINKKVNVEKQPLLCDNLDLDLPIDVSAISVLGDACVSEFGTRDVSTNVLPLSRIDPIYPRRARIMKKEGYVKLEFTITTFGTVKDVEVVAAQPPKLFEASATSALLKWRFKPKVEENHAVEQRAMVQIDFRLHQ